MKLQIPYGKISGYKVGKILKHFIVDVEAAKAAELLGLHRHTVEEYYTLFRTLIYTHQLSHFQQLSGVIELDESYFGARRVRGHHVKLKRGRGTRKQPVFSMNEADEYIPKSSRTALVRHCRPSLNTWLPSTAS